MTKYRCYSTQRPIMPGGIPDRGMINVANFRGKRFVPDIKMEAWGYADFDRQLTPREVNDYELYALGKIPMKYAQYIIQHSIH